MKNINVFWISMISTLIIFMILSFSLIVLNQYDLIPSRISLPSQISLIVALNILFTLLICAIIILFEPDWIYKKPFKNLIK